MYCTTPNVVKLNYDKLTENGKPSVKFYGGKQWTNVYQWEDIEKLNIFNNSVGNNSQYVRIPCRNCRICRIKNNFEWVTRMQLEALGHNDAYFLTLTYDDEHLPVIKEYDYKGVKYINNTNQGSLEPRDLELFWKRLRKNWKLKNLKYYACGEYGPSGTHRPHYHAIVYDLELIESNLIKVPRSKDLYYSEELSNIWGKGFVGIRKISENAKDEPMRLNTTALMYVAGYILKKRNGEKNWIEDYLKKGKFVKEFQRCSTGLGKEYFLNHKEEIYIIDGKEVKHDEISNEQARVRIKKLNYFDRKMSEEKPEMMDIIKRHRQELAEQEEKARLKKSTLTLAEQFKIDNETQRIKLNQSFESKMKRKRKENSAYDPDRTI